MLNTVHPTRRERAVRAVWVGLAGGLLFGLTEAWALLAGNTAQTGSALAGIVAAMGFIVALDGALGAVGLGLAGALAAQFEPLRRRFADAAAWTALCAGLYAGGLTLLYSLDRFGVLDGTVTGTRAALFGGIALIAGLLAGALAYGLARSVHSSLRFPIARLARRALAAAWIVAALLPLIFALIRTRLG
jgi:hypothetical protein